MLFDKMPDKNFYFKNRENVKWKCPGLFEHDKALFLLHDICKELNIQQPISFVFGGILSNWNGGRPPQLSTITEKELYEIFKNYNERNITCYLTFSNYNITKDELDDKIGNLVCKVMSDLNSNNGVIVTSDLLSNYIREKYPNIKQVASVIKPHYEAPNFDETPDYYNKLSESYDKVCIRPEFNVQIDFLKKLKHKDKIELMVNQVCFKKCPIAKTHYDRSAIKTIDELNDSNRIRFCQKKSNDIQTYDQHLNNSAEQIDKIIKLGFYNLKLKGRGASPNTLLSSIIGRYIFDPTGYFPILEDYILNKLDII
ncbi:MAG: hypothetical protein IJY61_09010 [Candidatus Gastranaerophilales bacterium]|nr:hypothetical protein [Candidatus Gastranaerophilales bacterium]